MLTKIVTLAALFNLSYAADGYDSTTPIVPMKDYTKPYRALDCS